MAKLKVVRCGNQVGVSIFDGDVHKESCLNDAKARGPWVLETVRGTDSNVTLDKTKADKRGLWIREQGDFATYHTSLEMEIEDTEKVAGDVVL